jgi:hypothetical protein
VGWNEPERVNVQSVEVKVDAALIAQLRTGYAEMSGAKPMGGLAEQDAELSHHKAARAQLDRVKAMREACIKEKYAWLPASTKPLTG